MSSFFSSNFLLVAEKPTAGCRILVMTLILVANNIFLVEQPIANGQFYSLKTPKTVKCQYQITSNFRLDHAKGLLVSCLPHEGSYNPHLPSAITTWILE